MEWTVPEGMKKASPGTDLPLRENVRQRSLRDVTEVLLPRDGPVEPDGQFGTLTAIDHIPHFRLAVGPVPVAGQIVARMHLHRQRLAGVDIFDKQRKFDAEPLIDPVADQIAHIHFDQFAEVVPGQRTVAHDGNVPTDVRDLPALADGLARRQSFPQFFGEGPSSPYPFLETRFEFQRIKHNSSF